MSDKYAVPNKLPSRQVSILAQRKKRILHDESIRNLQKKNIRKVFNKKRKVFHKADHFVSQFLKGERDENRITRKLSSTGICVKIPDEEKLLVVLRIRAKKIASPVVKTALKCLGVGKMHRASLVKVNTETKALLGIVDPYVSYGYPNINTVRELVFKHGFLTINGKKIPITSNTEIEEHLGTHNIICVEDIVHELITVGDNFDVVRNHLGSFSLAVPKDGYQNKRGKRFDKGGEYGNREQLINDLIIRCM